MSILKVAERLRDNESGQLKVAWARTALALKSGIKIDDALTYGFPHMDSNLVTEVKAALQKTALDLFNARAHVKQAASRLGLVLRIKRAMQSKKTASVSPKPGKTSVKKQAAGWGMDTVEMAPTAIQPTPTPDMPPLGGNVTSGPSASPMSNPLTQGVRLPETPAEIRSMMGQGGPPVPPVPPASQAGGPPASQSMRPSTADYALPQNADEIRAATSPRQVKADALPPALKGYDDLHRNLPPAPPGANQPEWMKYLNPTQMGAEALGNAPPLPPAAPQALPWTPMGYGLGGALIGGLGGAGLGLLTQDKDDEESAMSRAARYGLMGAGAGGLGGYGYGSLMG